ncbi:tetratricopeptide repeat protein [Mangrovibacterium lignilyticum]|uniref:tetratricopeptide repeat protein n=1 Tax=Mangrovibacterium lignilyticum TaxID=2668052 RepID=UPI0013D27F42|nr:tetratricopeptide repeat protein [Mangrovibacterium lignilyticum]
MIRKSNITEYIDKYLSQELTGDELREFNAEMAINPEVEEELELHQAIEAAIQETDITELRSNLQAIMDQESEEEFDELIVAESESYSFELSEDLSSFKEFKSPVNINDIINFGQSLPKLHLAQHKIAEKENIHQFYKEQLEESNSTDEEFELTPFDEAIFAEVQVAMAEKDVADLRANLQQIATNLPAHEFSSDKIDQYINQELDADLLKDFENELAVNEGLMHDIGLYREVDQAIGETDIMDLRANLASIQQTEASTSRKVEEIDQFLNMELSEDELASFESELSNNPDLVAELELFKEIDSALEEKDVMGLRDKLDRISKDIIKEKRKERSFIARIPNSRIAVATIAASLILLISITSLLSRHQVANERELYSEFFRPYEATGIFRSNNSNLDSKISIALHKYNEANYAEAVQLFNEVLQSDSSNPVGNFYQGMSYQGLGEFNQAISSYNEVIKAKNNLFMEQAEWYTALCYLQNDNRRKAFKQLQRIAENNGYYSEKASAVLRKITDIE